MDAKSIIYKGDYVTVDSFTNSGLIDRLKSFGYEPEFYKGLSKQELWIKFVNHIIMYPELGTTSLTGYTAHPSSSTYGLNDPSFVEFIKIQSRALEKIAERETKHPKSVSSNNKDH